MDINKYFLRTQTNQLFEMITSAELTPNEFIWEQVNFASGVACKLVHISSGFYFTFYYPGGSNYISAWSPAKQSISETGDAKNWDGQMSQFRNWLFYLKREIQAPDLWGAISQETEIVEATATDTDNTPFSKSEKEYIKSGVREIKEYLLKAHNLSEQNATLVEGRLNYLIEASARVGKKDWINLLLSVLVGIIINTALPADSARDLLRFAGQALKEVLHSPLLLI